MSVYSTAEAVSIALEYEKNGLYEQAVSIYRQLVQSFPGKTAYHEKLMAALFYQGRIEESLAAFCDSVALQPDNDDPQFESSYLLSMRATSSRPWPVRRRARFHGLVKMLSETSSLDGAVAECGCFRGLSSHLMCSTLRARSPGYRGAGYHIFDSFRGLSAPTLDDDVPPEFKRAREIKAMCIVGAFAASLDQVRQNLAEFPEIEFHPGWIPLTFRGLPERKYRFVHADVDLYDPTIESFEYFYPRLAAGGILVSDDYGWPGARKAVEEFCSERKLEFTVTEYQQAVLRKPG